MPENSPEDSLYDFAEPVPPKKPAPAPPKPKPPARQPLPGLDPVRTAAPAKAPPVAPEADQTLRTCMHCGYSYLGKIKARCPECAAPMESAADLLQFAGAGWVRSVALGLLLLVPATALHIAGCILNRMSNFTRDDARADALMHAKGITHLAGAVLMVIGVFLATRRQSGAAEGGRSVAWWARGLSVATLLVWCMAAAVALEIWPPQWGSFAQIKKYLTLLVLPPQGALCILLAFHCLRLARRIPNDSIAAHSNYTGWLSAVVCATLFGLIALELDKGDFPQFFMCSFPLVSGLGVILLWTMITLLRLALDMRNSAGAGEAIAYERQNREAARKKPPTKEWREVGEH